MSSRRPNRPGHSRQRSDQIDLLDQGNMAHSQVPFLKSLPLAAKNHLVAVIAEFVGTFLFLLFALGGANAVNTASSDPVLAANPAKLLYICLCFGTSLAVNVWIFYRVSGGQFNPAVTIALVAVGAVGFLRGLLIIIGQLLGAIASSAVLLALLPGPLVVATTLRADTSTASGFFIEMFLTVLLVLTILMLAVEKHRATYVAPLGIGLALFMAEMMGVPYTGGSLNPARSFGPCLVNGSFENYHWIYWIGPILGALAAVGFYKLIKLLEYETVNPGQDDTGLGARHDDGVERVSHGHAKGRPDLEAGNVDDNAAGPSAH